MALSINSNLAGGAVRALARAEGDAGRAMQRLSSGLRINAASDDAAGLAIATRMQARITGLGAAARNAQDAISLAQTADGGLASIGANLQRLRELAVQSANATNSASDRASLQVEAAQLIDEIDRVAKSTRFNGQALLDGSLNAATFQVGTDAGQTIDLSGLASVRAGQLGIVRAATPPVVSTTALTGSTLTAASTIDGPGQLVINGVDVWQGSPVAADAAALAAAISAAGVSGLSVTAAANVAAGTWRDVGGNDTITINHGTTLYYSFTGIDEATSVWVMNYYLNSFAIAPGVAGSDNGAGVTLTAADGRNITIQMGSGGPDILGLGGIAYGVGTDGTTYSHVNLSYTGTAGLSIAGSKATALGLPLVTAPPPPPPTLPSTFVDTIDLSTVAGANSALSTLDASIGIVDGQRALLGATQNRFASAIAQTRAAAGDAEASRSRIVDADYGAEAAELVRSQILQQAGLAMVAQANAQRGDVLRLVRG